MTREPTAQPEHFRVAIVGSGFAGIGLSVRLLQAGIDDFVVLERAADVGGVWRDNQYPGCACDVQSHLYSFSFAPNPTWSRSYSPAGEIWEYLRDVARRFGVTPHVRFEHVVEEATWDEGRRVWRIRTSKGDLTADAFVAANGGLSEPSFPDLPGLASFEGKTMHSARWDHDYDLAGKRVAVVGTGASAIQFVPRIQPKVQRLTVFQRTPAWIVPRRDHTIPEARRRFYERHPRAQKAVRAAIYGLRELLVLGFRHPELMKLNERVARRHLERQVPDPALRAKLTPSYRIGCKRILISDDYLPSLTKPNVEVVTSSIREVRARAVVTADGGVHEVDAIIFGTGFQVTEMKIAKQVRGRGGKTLDDVWQGSPKAHLGTTVAGFPSFFMMQGPNTGLGHTSVIVMIESQIEHVVNALRYIERRGLAAVEPRPEAQAEFVARVDERMRGTVWTSGGCKSWYLDRNGRNSTLWPGQTFTFARRVEPFDPREYVGVARPRAATTSAAGSTEPAGIAARAGVNGTEASLA